MNWHRRPNPNPLPMALALIALTGILPGAGEQAPPKAQCTATGCSAAGSPAANLSATEIAGCLGKIANQPLGNSKRETTSFCRGKVARALALAESPPATQTFWTASEIPPDRELRRTRGFACLA